MPAKRERGLPSGLLGLLPKKLGDSILSSPQRSLAKARSGMRTVTGHPLRSLSQPGDLLNYGQDAKSH
jgi:hypothetical protein